LVLEQKGFGDKVGVVVAFQLIEGIVDLNECQVPPLTGVCGGLNCPPARRRISL
jgi:hypothetical protein